MPAPVIPTLTAAPPAPLRSQAPATFTLTAETFVDWQGDFPTEMNLVIDAIGDMATYMEGLTGSSGPITATALTMGTGKLLGRYSASTGAIQEITIGAGLSLDGAGNLTAAGGYTDEEARDAIGAALVEGAGIDITVNDGGDTITVASTITQYTDEMARDAIGAALVAGSNVTITVNDAGDTITIASTGGGSGNAWFLQGGPMDNEPPTSNYATLDSRNGHPVLDFDTTTQESAVWTRALPADYSGGGVTVNIWCSLTSATSGTVGWLVSLERIDASSLDIDSDSFATAQTVTAVTVPGTSGQVLKMSVNISNGANMDSLAAGELFRLKIARDVTNDTATGDAELLRWEMKAQ